MPRVAREKSSTGVYHVILKGINSQVIFEDDEDFRMLFRILYKCQKISGFTMYAYCFMGNHIHLLIKEQNEELGIIFRRIGATYVRWYNEKYARRGHLFQDRFRSEVVETEKYLLTVLRYIHQNPIKAGIAKDITSYKWSSYKEYTGKPWICDTEFILGLFSDDKENSAELFKEFHSRNSKDKCLEFDSNIRLTDSEAANIIKGLSGTDSVKEIQGFTKEKRNNIIRACKNQGLSIRQIERLTGISFAIIRRI